MRILAHDKKKTTELFISASIGRLNLYRKQCTKYETVAKIPDKQVATVCSTYVYNVIRIFRFPKSVTSYNRWPTYKGGQLHGFYLSL
jgi:hypothetical protein